MSGEGAKTLANISSNFLIQTEYWEYSNDVIELCCTYKDILYIPIPPAIK